LGKLIEDVEIYEDRISHRDAFENYLQNWRRKEPIINSQNEINSQISYIEKYEENEIGLKDFKVHFITMPLIQLDEQVEENLVRIMVAETNAIDMLNETGQYIIEKKIYALSYGINKEDFEKMLKTYLPFSNEKMNFEYLEWKPVCHPSIFIHFSASPYILSKVGGIGKRVEFEITHVSFTDRVIAVRLEPITSYHEVTNEDGENILREDPCTRFWTKNSVPLLVLATRNGGTVLEGNYLEDWNEIPLNTENRRFIGAVAARQEISIELVSNEEAERCRHEELNGKTDSDGTCRSYCSLDFPDSNSE
jgi:hypothetical protein